MPKKDITQAAAKKCLRKYQALLGLLDWKIELSYAGENTTYASCVANPAHKKATVTLNLDEITDDDLLEGSIRHELFHVILWRLSENARTLAVKEGDKLLEAEDEAVVWHLENMPLWKALTS